MIATVCFFLIARTSPTSVAQFTQVSTHGNADFPGKTEEDFSLNCTQCHDFFHGGGPNLALIGESLEIQTSPVITAGPIVFTATTGPNSFDDGSSPPNSRVCVGCHTSSSRPGSGTALNHTGGTGHIIGNTQDYTGQNCITCHPHDADGNPATSDGFMPSAGCTDCHAQAQDRPGVGPAGGRRMVVQEFGSATIGSHHVVSGTIAANVVTDTDCKACHLAELASHADGYVQLSNADTAAVYSESVPGAYRPENISLADSKALQPFCLSCHDSDGANGDLTPFSDGQTVPDIEGSGLWSQSAHNTGETTNSGYGCLGDGITNGCHATAHGSNLAKLLAPASGTPGANNVNQEEGFCYTCHDGGVVSGNMQSEFNRASHHDVDDGEQAGTGTVIECTNCHNPHRAKAATPLTNPDDTYALWKGTDTNFCLACHDGNPPAGVAFPTTWAGTGYNKSAYMGSTHSINLDGYGCRHCHDKHGTNYRSILVNSYIIADYNRYRPNNGETDYDLCWTCHDDDLVTKDRPMGDNTFEDLHDKHVQEKRSPCILCHDAHAPFDSGEAGLISFEFSIRNGYDIQHIDGYNDSTAFWLNNNRGYCYLQCHNKPHDPYDYVHFNADTTNCTACHPGGAPLVMAGVPAGFQLAAGLQFNQPGIAPLVLNKAIAGVETQPGQAIQAQTPTGVVNDPADTLSGDGYFHGDGVDNYIVYENNDTSLQAGTNLIIETRLKPAGLAGTASYIKQIFDRGTTDNYRITIWRDNSWATYNAPADVASIALWVKPTDTHGGATWKPVLTNYNICPIVSDHWYQMKIMWDSDKVVGIPGIIYVDDQGLTGDNTGEVWSGYKNCTDFNQTLLPTDKQLQPGDKISLANGDFTVGTSAADHTQNLFKGLIDWIEFYFKEQHPTYPTHSTYLPLIVRESP